MFSLKESEAFQMEHRGGLAFGLSPKRGKLPERLVQACYHYQQQQHQRGTYQMKSWEGYRSRSLERDFESDEG